MTVRVPKFGNVRTTSPVVLWTSKWVSTGTHATVATLRVRGIVNPDGRFGFIVNKNAQLLAA